MAEAKQANGRIAALTILLFLLAVAYCILRSLKDAVTLTGSTVGAEVIPFLKVWGMLPGSILMTLLFTWMSRRIPVSRLFHFIVAGFLIYYASFALWIFPHRESLELTALGTWLATWLPSGSRGLIRMVQHWPVSSFYVMSELWGTMIINVLFWGIANERMSTETAKKFYGKIKIGATSSAIAGGYLASLASIREFDPTLPYGSTVWEQTLLRETACVLFLGIAAMILFYWISRGLYAQEEQAQLDSKVPMSVTKAVQYVYRSPYLICLAIVVVGYNLAFNLSDVLWKQQVSLSYPDPNDLLAYMNTIMMLIGVVSLLAVLSSGMIIRRLGWTALGGLTPAAMLATSLVFFAVWFGGFPLHLVLAAGAMNNCISKAGKYSIYGISKELAFTPLDAQTKWNGKAAIDGIGNDVGKTGASLIHQGLLMVFGSMMASVPLVAGIIFATLVSWLGAIFYIGRSFEQLSEAPVKATD